MGKPRLVEQIYRKGIKLYRKRQYRKAWVEFNKVRTLDSSYKKTSKFIEKIKQLLNNIQDTEELPVKESDEEIE